MPDLMSIGLSGLTSYRNALAAVGENVANAETPGFTRRTVRLTPGPTGGTGGLQYRDNVSFGGVRTAGVQRAWDQFKAAEAQHAGSAAGRTEAREQWLTAIETSLDDGPAGIGARITGFFNAADALAAMPDDRLGRTRVLMALEDTAAAFRSTSQGLTRISAGIGTTAQLDVQSLNTSLAALAQVNTSLAVAADGGTARAVLQDERDRIVGAIAERIGVVASYGENGVVRLDLADPPGSPLVAPGTSASFAVAAAADGRLTVQVTTGTGASAITPLTGRLAGLLEAANSLADRRAGLDLLAADFATSVNAWSAAGRDQAGAAGGPLLAAAAGAGSMQALETDPARLAAASPGGAPNGNLLQLAALRGAAGAERRWTLIVAGHAQHVAAARSEHAAAAAWRDNSFAALDETTGIDLDREAADLLRYQQAYSAAARIVQVGRDTVNDVLQLF